MAGFPKVFEYPEQPPGSFQRPVLSGLISEMLEQDRMGALAESVSYNLQSAEQRARMTNSRSGLEALAALVGGLLIEADLFTGEDAGFSHGFQRIMSTVLFSVDLDGHAGRIYGHPDGGDPPLNERPWTDVNVFVRPERSGRFAFVVI